MSQTALRIVEPDVGFVNELMRAGADTLKQCFQCGNCSVVCNISPEIEPFPRKEVVWAQWGLKERLLADADVWLCHDCNDCTTHCPRGAKPADVMAAVRNLSFQHYAGFGFMGRWLADKKFLPLLFLFPALWIAVFAAGFAKPDFLNMQPLLFIHMMPVTAVDLAFLPPLFLAGIATLLGIARLWKAMKASSPGAAAQPVLGVPAAALRAARTVFSHKKMRECGTNAPRAKGHAATMYGFIALIITTTMVALLYWANKFEWIGFEYHHITLSHPVRLTVKLMGNVGGILAATGLTLMMARRYRTAPADVGSTGYYDSHFIFVLWATIVTGFLAEGLRVLGTAIPAFGIYYIHLIFVFALLVYAPFSKFAHLFYRFTAMTYAEHVGRERPRETTSPVAT